MEIDSEGYRIDWSNKADINKFETSTDWHAFLVGLMYLHVRKISTINFS